LVATLSITNGQFHSLLYLYFSTVYQDKESVASPSTVNGSKVLIALPLLFFITLEGIQK